MAEIDGMPIVKVKDREPDMVGAMITTPERDDKYPVGSRVAKTNSRHGDGHKDGDEGIIAAQLFPPDELAANGIHGGYWVRWDDMPDQPVFVEDRRVRLL